MAKKINYVKINSKTILDAKYILLFYILSWYVKFVLLSKCQLKEIDSTCIIFGEKIIVWRDIFFRFVKDSNVYVKHGRPFQKQHGKLARKRCLFICFMTPLFCRPVLFVKHLYFIVYYFISIPIFLLITFKIRECHHSKS